MDEEKGMILELTPEVAEALRSLRIEEKNETQEVDDWQDVIAIPNKIGNNSVQQEPMEEEDGDKMNDEEHERNSSDGLSLSPPSSLPVVFVDLERLVGYTPSSAEEADRLRQQVTAALRGQDDVTSENGRSNPQEDGHDDDYDNGEEALASHFDERVADMFANRIAQHADTSQEQVIHDNTLRYCVIGYPEYLCQRSTDPPVVLNTARIWKRLLQTHDIAFVNRLLVHLKNCSRSLLWKDAMRTELLHLAKSEQDAMIRRQQQGELDIWRTKRRKQQLEKLYSVRETLEHRVEVAQARLAKLEEERDNQVAHEIRRRRLEGQQAVGLQAFDFESTLFAFPSEEMSDNNLLGLTQDDDAELEEDEYALMSDYELNSSSCDDDNDDDTSDEGAEYSDVAATNAEADDRAASSDALSFPLEGVDREPRRKAAAQRRRKRLQIATQEAKHKAKLEAAKAQEEELRQALTTPELKMAAAVVQSLKVKLDQVDELLESLQEEEWQDEEEHEERGVAPETTKESSTEATSSEDGTLLEQILAMILGALYPIGPRSMEEQYGRLAQEHQSIREEWASQFGRLPPPLVEQPPPTATTASSQDHGKETQTAKGPQDRQALREAFGIPDEEVDDWEDIVDDEVDDEKQASSSDSVPRKVGLRPGGRLE